MIRGAILRCRLRCLRTLYHLFFAYRSIRSRCANSTTILGLTGLITLNIGYDERAEPKKVDVLHAHRCFRRVAVKSQQQSRGLLASASSHLRLLVYPAEIIVVGGFRAAF